MLTGCWFLCPPHLVIAVVAHTISIVLCLKVWTICYFKTLLSCPSLFRGATNYSRRGFRTCCLNRWLMRSRIFWAIEMYLILPWSASLSWVLCLVKIISNLYYKRRRTVLPPIPFILDYLWRILILVFIEHSIIILVNFGPILDVLEVTEVFTIDAEKITR